MNTQKPERILHTPSDELQIVDVFPTIQGEGPHAGRPATFVRLAGCNLQCPLCDTDYTSNRERMPVQRLVEKVAAFGGTLVVITGGEPMRQPIQRFVEWLLKLGYEVQIETNGAIYRDLPYGNKRLSIVCSPKTASVNHQLVPFITAFKYVARAKMLDTIDGLPNSALDHPTHTKLFRPPLEWFVPLHAGERRFIYLQPCDEQDEELNTRNMEAVVESCRRFGYRLCLQLHKIIGVP